MHCPHRSDRSTRGLVRLRDLTAAQRHRHDPESGQATVEFALILFPLLTLVTGIIYFGIGLNYWLDMQRIANQGARWAAVNCGQAAAPAQTPNPCQPSGQPSLQATLREQAMSRGLRGCLGVEISFPGGQNEVGDPVKVRLESPFTFFWIDRFKVMLGADATMRLEAKADAYDPVDNLPTTC
jgi:TadE-like protein